MSQATKITVGTVLVAIFLSLILIVQNVFV